MAGRWRDALLFLATVAVALLVALALRPAPPPAPAEQLLTGAPPSTATPAATGTPAPQRSPGGFPLTATRGRARPVVLFVGDSYVQGVGASRPGQSDYVALLAARFTWYVHRAGSAGGGYLTRGSAGTVADLLESYDVAKLDPDLVVLQAGHNDVAASQPSLADAVTAAVVRVRQLAPQAQVDVVGVFWPGPPPEPAARTADEAIRRGAAAAGALFSAAADLRFPGDAGNRPTDEGYRLVEERLAASFRELGLVG